MAAEKREAQKEAPVAVTENRESMTLSNGFVDLKFDFAKRSYSITDAADQTLILDKAWMAADGWLSHSPQDGWKISHQCEPVADAHGQGMRVVVAIECPRRVAVPVYLFRYTLYADSGVVVMGFGLRNTCDYGVRLMTPVPLLNAALFPGEKMENPLTLNGAAGAENTQVKPGITRESPNSLMLTGLVKGKRRTLVWGGLANKEFGKYAAVRDDVLELKAQDPVGRLVDAGQTYWSEDTFYLDAVTADPFVALEQYGRAMQAANNAHPNVYDFPVLCGWGVGALCGLGDVNNSKLLIGQMEAAQKCGLTKYTKVGIQLVPDSYCYGSGNTEQGWWDDAHWMQFGHLVQPYETFAKWGQAMTGRDGVPCAYFQTGLPSDDYARAFPGHMLFNDISRLAVRHPHHQPLVSFDYTDPDFQKHMQAVWQRLRNDGVRSIMFDYPETGWRPEGGFENRYATTASAYREIFRLCRGGLGADAFLDERNLGESGRPCLDLTAGLVDIQRTWTDSKDYSGGMVSIDGLRWYKNRTVFNYYPDTKTVHDLTKEICQSMLTMLFLTSGRINLATSFNLFTPETVHNVSRVFPPYRESFAARPLDAFTGVTNPQVYDLELTPDWHQVALFNAANEVRTVSVPLSGERVTTGAVGLDPAARYYVYDFWADKLIGKLSGTSKVEMRLSPLHCAMLSVRKTQPVPQVLSTSRHVLQGWVDLANVKWDAANNVLSGEAKVIGGEPFRIVLAANGLKMPRVTANVAQARLEGHPAGADFATLVLERPDSGEVSWSVVYE